MMRTRPRQGYMVYNKSDLLRACRLKFHLPTFASLSQVKLRSAARRGAQLLEPSGGGGGEAAFALAAGQLLLAPAQVALAASTIRSCAATPPHRPRQRRARPGHVASHALTAAGATRPAAAKQCRPPNNAGRVPAATRRRVPAPVRGSAGAPAAPRDWPAGDGPAPEQRLGPRQFESRSPPTGIDPI
jgi:hypothetical protein